jgi:hypothetical protein
MASSFTASQVPLLTTVNCKCLRKQTASTARSMTSCGMLWKQRWSPEGQTRSSVCYSNHSVIPASRRAGWVNEVRVDSDQTRTWKLDLLETWVKLEILYSSLSWRLNQILTQRRVCFFVHGKTRTWLTRYQNPLQMAVFSSLKAVIPFWFLSICALKKGHILCYVFPLLLRTQYTRYPG